ncbi:MAG: hypothetical protein COA32_14975 [Fluviicola sp.]|nr:MAG: hypothetical protein COA32_14975 [Fluviicola sp.]
MLNDSQIEKFKKQMTKDLVKGSVKELKQVKKPEDLTPEKAYNLVQTIFSFWITSGKTPQATKEELTTIVNDAYEDFLEQTKLPE